MHLYKNSTHLGRVCNFIIYIRTCLGDIDSNLYYFSCDVPHLLCAQLHAHEAQA